MTDCIMDIIIIILKNFEIVKFITTAFKEHLKLSKIAKFGCEML